MKVRRFCSALSSALVASGALASVASATTLSVTATPTLPGEPANPKPVTVGVDTTVDGFSNTSPATAAPATLTQTLPSEFTNTLSAFPACPTANYDSPDGSEDPHSTCPAESLVGTGTLSVWLFQIGAAATVSDERVAIVKSDADHLVFWFLPPTGRSGRITGTVTTVDERPVVTWDIASALPNQAGPPGQRVGRLVTNYNVNAGLAAAPFASTGCSTGDWPFDANVSYVGGNPADSPATATAPCSQVRVVLGKGSRNLKKVLKKGLRFKVLCAEPCTSSGKLLLSKGRAKKLGLKRVVARGKGGERVTVKLNPKAKRAFRKLRKIRLELQVVARDEAGNELKATKALTLKR